MEGWILPTTALIGGGGLAYYFLSLRDTTPVGLTIVKRLKSGGVVVNEDVRYGWELIDGTYRESESSLPINSGENNLIFVLSDEEQEGVIHAELIPNDTILLKNPAEMEEVLEYNKKMRELVKNVESNTEELDKAIEQAENSLNESNAAEMTLRPSNTLQSHFVW